MNTIERIRAAQEALSTFAVWPADYYWIESDRIDGIGADDYCRACAQQKIAGLKRKHPGAEFFLCCGSGSESDGSVACCACGEILHYCLTGHGRDEEIDHFLQYGCLDYHGQFHPITAFEIYAILSASEWSKDETILSDALRIGETAVALIGYDA
jgi:hypothetical protein